MIDMIAFDADDTLWHNEVHYQEAQSKLVQILSPWGDPGEVRDKLHEVEMRNLALYGYGVKAFLLSMIETGNLLSDGEIFGAKISEILSIGRQMLEAQVTLLPHVRQTLDLLSKSHRLMVITKGDPIDQNNKITRSGLAHYFNFVEVIGRKTQEIYRIIFEKFQLDPKAFLMVGNSLRSDILPVLELGGKAVYIPAETTWAHEMIYHFDPAQEGFYQLEDISRLPNLIDQLS